MVGTTECPSKLAWGATESEPSNIHGEQPAAMHQSNENVGNVPNRSQESPLHYSVQLEDIIGLLSQSLAQQREMLQEYQKTIQELRLEKKEMQQEYQKTIQELRLEKKEMQQEYQKAEKERDEMMAKLRKEMTKEREEYLKKMKQLNDKLAYKEDYARRLKNRGFFCRLFNLEPL